MNSTSSNVERWVVLKNYIHGRGEGGETSLDIMYERRIFKMYILRRFPLIQLIVDKIFEKGIVSLQNMHRHFTCHGQYCRI